MSHSSPDTIIARGYEVALRRLSGLVEPRHGSARESSGESAYTLGPREGPEALLLHGLTGSPWDLRPLAEALATHGYRAQVPLLAGHANIDALETHGWRDWLASAEKPLRESTAPCVLLGFSMGGLLALELAARHPTLVRALVTLAVPLRTPTWQLRVAGVLARLREVGALHGLVGRHKKQRIDVRVQSVAKNSPSFAHFPYPSIVELGTLQTIVRQHLSDVRAPTLIMHARFDHSADPRDSAELSQRIGSSVVQRVVLPRSYHLIPRDLDSARSGQQIVDFLAMIDATSARERPHPSEP